jgi:ribosome-associated toxin RatA of RatAB toxin-antitoxin module
MATVERSILVEYSAEEMRALVDDIGSYPQFLPWCGGTEIVSREPGRTVATIRIDYRGIRQAFTTENLPLSMAHPHMPGFRAIPLAGRGVVQGTGSSLES